MNKKTKNEPVEETALHFMIQRLYIKDLSFEAPNTPAIFKQTWQPDLSIDVQIQHTHLEQTEYEVVLHITATVKNQNTTAFLVEIKQAGIFSIQGAEGSQLSQLLEAFCPQILFPYAREAITSEALRGSFPQLILAPINFDALYFKKLEEGQKTDIH